MNDDRQIAHREADDPRLLSGEGILDGLQRDMAAALKAAPVFATAQVTVVAERDGDFAHELERILQSGRLAVFVGTPKMEVQSSREAVATIEVQVIEPVPLNRANADYLSALRGAEFVIANLWCRKVSPAWTVIQPLLIELVSQSPDLIYRVSGTTRTMLDVGE